MLVPAASSISVTTCGRQWQLYREAKLEQLWDAMTEDPNTLEYIDERIPYWTELWPSSVILAEWLGLQKKHIAGQMCLDIGCGLGLTAMVASWLGARVVAMDYMPQALRYAQYNATMNNVIQPAWVAMDWRQPALLPARFDYIWGGDIMYELRFVTPVITFLQYVLAPQGRVWIAEPDRSVYDAFRHALHTHGWSARKVHCGYVDPLYAQPVMVSVHIWELTKND